MNNFENVRKRVFTLALNIIEVCKELPKTEINRIIVNQLLRSCTSIGANLEEAAGALTRTEFIYIMNLSRREARETNYWLRLLFESNNEYIKGKLKAILQEAEEIAKILTVSVKSAQHKKT